MEQYFKSLLDKLEVVQINILDAYIAFLVRFKYPDLKDNEFENYCLEVKDKYLKSETNDIESLV